MQMQTDSQSLLMQSSHSNPTEKTESHWPVIPQGHCFPTECYTKFQWRNGFHCDLIRISSRLKSPNQSQISKLISQYQQFYYTEDFRNLTHKITRFYASFETMSKNLQAAKPQPKAAEQDTISRLPLGLKASQPTRTYILSYSRE